MLSSAKNQIILGPLCYPEKLIVVVLQNHYSSTLRKSDRYRRKYAPCVLFEM